ncbi:hypothetical protein M8J77_008389 [Diaphorina citri]|nr:hypothetical protein M8J77_008389 [Diaphorina citri]
MSDFNNSDGEDITMSGDCPRDKRGIPPDPGKGSGNATQDDGGRPKPFLYELNDEGPFVLFVQGSSGNGIERIHPMALGTLFKRLHPDINNKMERIFKNGKNRLKLVMKDRLSANILITSDKMKEKGFSCFIPKFLVTKQGIIKGVYKELSEEEIKEECEVPYELKDKIRILSVKRFNRKENELWVPSETVQLTFRAQTLPSYVTIHYVRCRVEPFIPKVLQCSKCLRYGHSFKFCKSTSGRCNMCGDESHETKDCSSPPPPKCVHCKGEHMSFTAQGSICPEYKKQVEIKTIMTRESKTFLEARAALRKKSYATASSNNNTALGTYSNPATPVPQTSTSQSNIYRKRRRSSPPHLDLGLQKQQELYNSFIKDNPLPASPIINNSKAVQRSGTVFGSQPSSPALSSQNFSFNEKWNARSAVANRISLERALFEQNIHIALISETWFKPGKFINFPGYNIIREDREDGKAGVAIFLKTNTFYKANLSYYKISNMQSCAVSLTYDENPISIVSFYNSPSNNITSQEWRRFFDSFHGPCIIGGDSNCHHQAWGCSMTDTKGRSLLDAMDDSNLFLMNTGEPTLMRSIHHRHETPFSSPTHVDEQNEMDKDFSFEELIKCIKPNSNSAPGMDNVHYSMLQNLPTISKRQLLGIFNNIWQSGNIPEQWRKIIVVPFIKQGKPIDNYKSYRPIALASCVLKTFERMVKNRLDWWLENNGLLPPSQNGFRKSRSVLEAQSSLILDIEQGFVEQKSTLSVFYDVEGAYNTIQIPILMNKLLKIKTPYRITRIVYSIISQRYLYLRINNELVGPKTACLGIGQGDILSCPLYSIYTMDLETSLPPNIKIVQFVDDFCIYSTDKSPEICEAQIKSGIVAVENYMSQNGLKISYAKSEAILFSRKRRPNISQVISIDDYEIPTSKKINIGYIDQYESAPEYAKQNCFLNEVKDKWPNAYLIFTDGSKTSESVASAFYDTQNKNSGTFKLQNFATIFTAEAFAILQALKYASSIKEKEVIIITDSKSCLEKLKNTSKSNGNPSHLILDIFKELSHLQEWNISVRFIWVRGHAGIAGNEAVDRLAKETARGTDALNPYPIPVLDVRAFKRQVEEDQSLDEKKTFDWMKTGKIKGVSEAYITSAQDQALRTKYYDKHILKLNNDDKCRLCKTQPETITHIISGCQQLAKHEYTNRHNIRVCIYVQRKMLVPFFADWKLEMFTYYQICKHFKFPVSEKWYQHNPDPVMSNDDVVVLYDQSIQTDRTILSNRPDIVIKEKKKKECLLICRHFNTSR